MQLPVRYTCCIILYHFPLQTSSSLFLYPSFASETQFSVLMFLFCSPLAQRQLSLGDFTHFRIVPCSPSSREFVSAFSFCSFVPFPDCKMRVFRSLLSASKPTQTLDRAQTNAFMPQVKRKKGTLGDEIEIDRLTWGKAETKVAGDC
jgi:hypothetical protein